MSDPHADGVVITISPNCSADLGVSAVTAQIIVAICHMSVDGIATDANVDNDKSGKIDDGNSNGRNEYKLGSSRKVPACIAVF